MKAEELMIGNKVAYKGDAGVYQILGFPDWLIEPERPVIIDRCPKEICPITKLKAIPLTKEWLEKLGFNEMITRKGYFLKPLTIDDKISLDGEDFIFHLKTGYVQADSGVLVHSIGIPIIYVHQLQNLYFALTGEELK